MADNWNIKEVTLTVSDYFDMLIKDLSGESYNKSSHRRNIQKLLNDRSEGSIEFKHQNISAILIELGLPYIPGYKPLANYQHLLKEAVEDYLVDHTELHELFSKFMANDITRPQIDDVLNCEEEVPQFTLRVNESDTENRYQVKRNYYKEELRNRRLGLLGEEFVISYERERDYPKLERSIWLGKLSIFHKPKGIPLDLMFYLFMKAERKN